MTAQDPELERIAERYRALKTELADLGFVSLGSLLRRHTSCGRPGCRCQAVPPQPHGPYFQWTRKLGGKTFTRRLSETEAALYSEWINNHRRLDGLVEQMEQVSLEAIDLILHRLRSRVSGR